MPDPNATAPANSNAPIAAGSEIPMRAVSEGRLRSGTLLMSFSLLFRRLVLVRWCVVR